MRRTFKPDWGGPYRVQLGKFYKPIIMIHFDLILGITLTLGCFAYYWSLLEDNSPFADFVPKQYMYLLIFFNTKYSAGITYLNCLHKKSRNKSSATTGLFWFRFCYDFFLFFVVLFVIDKDLLRTSDWFDHVI